MPPSDGDCVSNGGVTEAAGVELVEVPVEGGVLVEGGTISELGGCCSTIGGRGGPAPCVSFVCGTVGGMEDVPVGGEVKGGVTPGPPSRVGGGTVSESVGCCSAIVGRGGTVPCFSFVGGTDVTRGTLPVGGVGVGTSSAL